MPPAEPVTMGKPFILAGKRGRPQFPVEWLLWWFRLSATSTEEVLGGLPPFRYVANVDGSDHQQPDNSTILGVRPGLAKRILVIDNPLPRAKGLMLRIGTAVDAKLFSAPGSTKEASGELDSEIKEGRMGQQWSFGMKALVHVNTKPGPVCGNNGSVNDVVEADRLMREQEWDVFANAGHLGAHKQPNAKSDVRWHVVMHLGARKVLDKTQPIGAALTKQIDGIKASISAIKPKFGHVKVRFRGLAENRAQLDTLFAQANLCRLRKRLIEGSALVHQKKGIAGQRAKQTCRETILAQNWSYQHI